MLEDVVSTGAVLIIAAAIFAMLVRRFEPKERPLLLAGLLAHVVGVFVQAVIVQEVYGGGDMDGYYRSGVELANGLRVDFEFFFPELMKVFFHAEETNLPFLIFGGSGPTASMTAVSAVLFYATGDSLFASSMVVGLLAYFGKVAIFTAISEGASIDGRRRMLMACLLVPSVVFWSSMLAKESLVIGFFGLAVLTLRPVVAGALNPARFFGAAVLLTPVALIKPYILLPFTLAFAVWLYFDRAGRRGQTITIRPAYAFLSVALTTVVFIAVGKVAPRVSVENLARSTAASQAAGADVEGGSNYQLREVAPAEEQSFTSQLALAPLALPTALFRPFLFESKNAMMFLNALETTALLLLTLRLLARGGLARVRRVIMGNSTLMFCLVFTVLMGTAVGLGSTNLGSLSRYRMPFMPFFVALLLVLDAAFQPREGSDRAHVLQGAQLPR